MPDGPPEAPDLYVVYDGADLPEPDLDAPLIEHRYERTEPRDTGAPWDMAAWIRADRARREKAGNFDPGGHREIVVPAWRPQVADLPRSPKSIATRCETGGWEVRLSTGTVYVTPALYVGTTAEHNRGDVKTEDYDDTWWSVQAILRVGEKAVAAFWASWATKEQVGSKTATTFDHATTHDLVLGRDFTKSATDFQSWLAVFTPPPPKAGKRASTA